MSGAQVDLEALEEFVEETRERLDALERATLAMGKAMIAALAGDVDELRKVVAELGRVE